MLFGLDATPLTEARAGVGHYTFELARALACAAPRDEFELLHPSSFPPANFDDDDGAMLPSNLRPVRVRVGALGRHWWAAGLPRYVRRRGLRLFHGTNYDVPLWGGAATVLTIHDLSLLLHAETHERRRVMRARRRLPLMARVADSIITPTESVRREVCEHLRVAPAKVFAVPEAARACFRPMSFEETKEARRALGVGEDFILAVGTLEPRKNLTALLRAFETIARERPGRQLQLVIAGGRGWLSAPLLEAVASSPARARIVMTGYLHDADLRALYSSCRAFVYPSVYEGFGLPPLEAMSCGAPVVAGRARAVAEVVGGAARIVNSDSHDDLASALVGLLDDSSERRELMQAGLARASQFSWERTARMTLEVYTETLRKRG
ncbi:MAG TPA: glycosyltransferase family 1 protein [Pyrinomonadaceae bacterium]|nr:glycosyltransferase family 1 protein [Pyrinomonadaceae bacterium]